MSQFNGADGQDRFPDLIEISTRRSALNAEREEAQLAREEESPWGVAALYFWAAFAFMASSLAGTTLLLNGFGPQRASPELQAGIQETKPSDIANPDLPRDVFASASDSPPAAPFPIPDWVDETTTAATNPTPPEVQGVLFGDFGPLSAIVPNYRAAQSDAALPMDGVEPLIRFRAKGQDYQAALVLGPFPDAAAAKRFCESSAKPCTLTPYSGDPLFQN